MNIFVTDFSPYTSAFILDDKRVNKMVLETCQLLSTAINVCGGAGPYKTTHKNHPCSIWARETKGNYDWLLHHFEALLKEYTSRYGKTHKCEQYYTMLSSGIKCIPNGNITQFVNCTPYREELSVFVAYRKCLNDKWINDKRRPTWYRQERKELL
jgi:hypothetical protein